MTQSELPFSPPANAEMAYGCEKIVGDAFDRIGSDASLARGVLEHGRRRVWLEVCHEETTNDISVYTSMACLLDAGGRRIMSYGHRLQQAGLLLKMYLDVLPGEPTLITHNSGSNPAAPRYWYGVSSQGGLGIQVSERFRDADPYVMLGDQRVRPLFGIDPAYSHTLKGPARKQHTRIHSGAAAISQYIEDEIIQFARTTAGAVRNGKEHRALHGRRAIVSRRLSALTSTLAAAGVEIGEHADEAELRYIERKTKKYATANFD